ncbi:MAG: zinc transporter ZupT [Promethearchaeota archaeon]
MDTFAFALLLSLLAGLSTTIGCIIAFFVKKPSPQFISFIMGFSAGVMILVSFVELLQEGIEANGFLLGMILFFVGMILMLILDILITHEYEFEDTIELLLNGEQCKDPSTVGKKFKGQTHNIAKTDDYHGHKHRYGHEDSVPLEKTSVLVFLGVFLHNLPEGMATFIGTMAEINLGIILAVAIALHNIPEGIAVSVPIYSCTGSRKKAFVWSFLSGISEFVGALIVGLILYPFINEYLLGAMLAIVAGIMIYISLDELLPVSHSFGEEHISIIGLLSGMVIMAISLIMLA